MLAFEVTINGEAKIVAGIEGLSVLSLILTYRKASGKEDDLVDDLDLSLSALLHHGKHDDEHVDWIKRNMERHDEITIRVVDTSNPDQTIERRRIDPKLVERSERRYYESLKKEYEKS